MNILSIFNYLSDIIISNELFAEICVGSMQRTYITSTYEAEVSVGHLKITMRVCDVKIENWNLFSLCVLVI